MKKYRHLFFDLDHTLWDFETNSRETLCELFEVHNLAQSTGTNHDTFYSTYSRINAEKWALYRAGTITKEELREQRFYETFRNLGIDDIVFSRDFEKLYLQKCPHRTALLPGAIEVLDYLAEKYELHILTNGFREVQDIKLEKSGLKPYFKEIISSETVGVNKPHERIFKESMKLAGASCTDSLMIGDNLEADVIGARLCGIDQVYFNPQAIPHEEEVTFEIRSLKELRVIL